MSHTTAIPEAPVTPESVLSKATLRASTALGMSGKDLAAVLGVSEATMSRLADGSRLLATTGKEWELAALFVRLYRSLDAILGGDDAASAAWLKSENTALGARPLDAIMTISGLTTTLAYLDARRAVL